jgi:hypothetical protein
VSEATDLYRLFIGQMQSYAKVRYIFSLSRYIYIYIEIAKSKRAACLEPGFTQNDHFTKTGSGRTQEKLMEKVHFACFAGKGQGAAGVGRFQV